MCIMNEPDSVFAGLVNMQLRTPLNCTPLLSRSVLSNTVLPWVHGPHVSSGPEEPAEIPRLCRSCLHCNKMHIDFRIILSKQSN